MTHTEPFRPFADADRRWILRTLVEAGGRTTVAELVEVLVGRREEPGDEATAGRIRRDLYHRHLPKLEAVGVVAYDWRSGDVVLEPDATDVEVLPGSDVEQLVELTG